MSAPLHRRARVRLAPSPLTGEGWGGGENFENLRTYFNALTSPQPSPSRRGGNFGGVATDLGRRSIAFQNVPGNKILLSTVLMSVCPQNAMVTSNSLAMISKHLVTPASPIAPKP